MKKLFLLSTAILMSTLGANAINWQPIEVPTPNIEVYLDMDSLRRYNADEYLYAIRYQALGQTEKIAYVRVNSKDNLVGIIEATEYENHIYRPNAYFTTPHALMKPLKEDTFFYFANDKIAQIASDTLIVNDENTLVYNQSGREILVSNKYAKDVLTPAELEDYLIKTCNLLQENWNPPKIGYGTRTIVIATIGTDGSLLNIKFTEPSGNDKVNRSVISALEKTVPYPPFNIKDTNVHSLDFQFVFENDMFRKAVVY